MATATTTAEWVAGVLAKARETRAATDAAAVARAAAQERDAATLEKLWPDWWAGLGSALDVLSEVVEPDTGRPLFRRFADARDSVIALVRDPSRGWIRFVPDADPPGALRVIWRVPRGFEHDAWRPVVVDGPALTVGGASDPAAFVRPVIEAWVAALGPGNLVSGDA